MIARSVFSNWGALVIMGAVSFFLTPVLIHGLGVVHYGMWILVATLMDYHGLLHLGLASTLQRFTARLQGSGERQALNEILVSAVAIMLGVAVLALGITLGLAFLLPHLFALDGDAQHRFSTLVLLLGSSIAVSLPTRMLGAYLCGLQRFDLHNLAGVGSTLLRAAALVVVVRLGYGVVGMGVVALAAAFLNLLLNCILVRYADPLVVLDFRLASWARARELMDFGFYVFVIAIADYFRFNMDSVVIVRFIGMASVAAFGVAASLTEYLRALVHSYSIPLLPAFSRLDGEGKEAEIRDLLLRATRITSLLSLLIGGLMLVHGRSVLTLWLGSSFAISSYPVLAALVTAGIIDLATSPCQAVIFARKRHRALAAWTFLDGMANLALSVYWAPTLGILGVALGTAVSMIAFKLVLLPWFALRVTGLQARAFLFAAVSRPLLVGAIFLPACFAIPGANVLPPLPLFWTLTWQTLFFALLALTLGCTDDDRRQLGKLLRGGGFGRQPGS